VTLCKIILLSRHEQERREKEGLHVSVELFVYMFRFISSVVLATILSLSMTYIRAFISLLQGGLIQLRHVANVGDLDSLDSSQSTCIKF